MNKCTDREHRCKALRKPHPRFMIVHEIDGYRRWNIWIPDFLREKDTTVKAFVWDIQYCPFCGADLADEKNSKKL